MVFNIQIEFDTNQGFRRIRSQGQECLIYLFLTLKNLIINILLTFILQSLFSIIMIKKIRGKADKKAQIIKIGHKIIRKIIIKFKLKFYTHLHLVS